MQNSTLRYNESMNTELQLIFRPLFENLGITDFGYVRYDNGGSYLMIESNHLWMETYYSFGYSDDINNPFSELGHIKQTPLNGLRVFPYMGKPETLVHSLLFNSGMWNGLSVYKRFNSYGEAYHFQGSTENTSLPVYLLNNIEVIKHFILYFHTKTKDLIDLNNAPKIICATKEEMMGIFGEEQSEETKIKTFLDATRFKKIIIPDMGAVITTRELNCLYHIATGKTAKEIAKILNISFRTVESYESIIKAKLGVNNKAGLIKIWEEKISHHISKYQGGIL